MGAFYGRAFAEARVEEGSAFDLRDNDYVWGQRKFGGNAQRMSSTRSLTLCSALSGQMPIVPPHTTDGSSILPFCGTMMQPSWGATCLCPRSSPPIASSALMLNFCVASETASHPVPLVRQFPLSCSLVNSLDLPEQRG